MSHFRAEKQTQKRVSLEPFVLFALALLLESLPERLAIGVRESGDVSDALLGLDTVLFLQIFFAHKTFGNHPQPEFRESKKNRKKIF